MSKHRKTETKHVNPLLGGALLAGAMMVAAPAGMALADTTGVNGRADTPFNQPGVNAIQTAGDKLMASDLAIPSLRAQGPVPIAETGVGATYHGLFGTPESAPGAHDGTQGLTVGVVNTFATPYKIQCNIVITRGCGSFG
jgi:hypothetical protein